jgi:hypothetical protein
MRIGILSTVATAIALGSVPQQSLPSTVPVVVR